MELCGYEPTSSDERKTINLRMVIDELMKEQNKISKYLGR
jgi:hypothetical protein